MIGAFAVALVSGLLPATAMAQEGLMASPPRLEEGAPVAPPDRRRLTRVVGGTTAKDGDWPSQVKIYAPDPTGRGRLRSHCGGTLIGARWVLTAAHCFVTATASGGRRQALAAQQLLVITGEARLPPVIVAGKEVARRGIGVRTLVSHPDFEPGTFANDIAVLELLEPADAPVVALLGADATDDDLAGLAGTVLGWGVTRETPGADADLLPADLQEAELPLVAISACRAAYRGSPLEGNAIGPGTLCAGFAGGGRDACRGDSGGPLMLRAVSGGWAQAGIVSWGEGCGRQGRHGVYTRVAAHEAWLRLVTQGEMALAALPSRAFPLSATASPQPGNPPPGETGPALSTLTPDALERAARSVPQGDRALVIGIDAYPAPLTLTGSVNDAEAVAALLMEALGFRREQVMVLTQAQATRDNILAALDSWLVAGSASGARVFLYYSGQGFQTRAFPALRDGRAGVGIAPVDLELVRTPDGHVRNVSGAITPTDLGRVLDRLSGRTVTAVFDTTQVSRRAMQRPVRARPGEQGTVRAVEASVDLAPAQRDFMDRATSLPESPVGAPTLWFAAAPDQWALVDLDGDRPMGAFTRRWITAMRALHLVGSASGARALHQTVRESLAQFCETQGATCRLGLAPQLVGPAEGAPAEAARPVLAYAARSLPPIENAASLTMDLTETRQALRIESRKAGYLVVLAIAPDGGVRQIYPDRSRLAAAGRRAREINRIKAGMATQIPLSGLTEAERAEGLLLAVFAEKPVQVLDVPERAGDGLDRLGALVFLHEHIRALRFPDPASGQLAEAAWSFATLAAGLGFPSPATGALANRPGTSAP